MLERILFSPQLYVKTDLLQQPQKIYVWVQPEAVNPFYRSHFAAHTYQALGSSVNKEGLSPASRTIPAIVNFVALTSILPAIQAEKLGDPQSALLQLILKTAIACVCGWVGGDGFGHGKGAGERMINLVTPARSSAAKE